MRRLSAARISKLEEQIAVATSSGVSAVFGVCNMARVVIRAWRLTANGPEAVEDLNAATIMIPERLEKLLFPKAYKIVWGGRGSAKTRTVAAIIAERARVFPERVLCLREIMKSIADSSYQELRDQIDRTGTGEEFRVTETKIKAPAVKSSIGFEGLLRNQTKIKGYAGSTIAWAEEAENISRMSWDYLTPTIRAEGSEIWITFNPAEEDDPTWADFVAPYWDKAVDGIYEDDQFLIIECNYAHNPWLTTKLINERDRMARTDNDRYLWIWEGQFRRSSDCKILNGKWIIQEFEPQKGWDGPYHGLDFGFSQDPTAAMRCWIHGETLYIEYEAGKVGLELDDTADFIKARIPAIEKYKIRADSARPESISHLKRKGLPGCEGAPKWTGSVEDGIAYLRSFEQIVIHPRCTETINEAKKYQYKVDKQTGDILTDIVDAYNHYIDAIRYALNPMIQGRGKINISKSALKAAGVRR